ncbi:RhoGAP domain-containing protein [Stachybotrys elegans]|uniref:RhoGAP domain-containing protein n=1 Tax=Stachybotrys elegans TaxID=80388 RepID=A0A8K0WVD2_9HYPO|nr:RhoGAP domain-containing protein [Stachybotrys elegans]
MASGNGLPPPADLSRNDYPGDSPTAELGYPPPNAWQNGGTRTPDSGYIPYQPPASAPGTPKGSGSRPDESSRQSSERSRSRQRSARSASGQMRICKKCGEPLTGQFVRALDGTFHLDCFKCRDCGEIVASKFFPADDEDGEGQYPLCETDYFRRLNLLCYQCGGALRGSYITALDRKYHVDHFTCSQCSTVFGAQDSYYEHDSNVYCHFHYSTQYAQRCNGCQTAILKQFVEIYRNGQDQHWHPECYMIHKFWNVRLSQHDEPRPIDDNDDPASRDRIREEEERMEEKVYRIWSVLSAFEESSAACISDMLLHVSNGAYLDGVLVAKRFIFHVEILFKSADQLEATMLKLGDKGMSYGREAKLLCKKIVSFFSLLSKAQDSVTGKLGVTQELLSLVTGLAHYLKLLIRICLQAALRLEREAYTSEGLYRFLDDLYDFENLKVDDGGLTVTTGGVRLSAKDSDHCLICDRSVEDECAKNGDMRVHLNCVTCSRCGRDLGRSVEQALFNSLDRRIYCRGCVGPHAQDSFSPFEHITKLQQYVFLLRVALARLLDILKSNGSLQGQPSDMGPNGQAAGNNGGHLGEPPRLSPENRSKFYSSPSDKEHHRQSSYENTLNDVRRLRSTRLDRHLSASVRQSRTSRVMDLDGRPGSAGAERGPADNMFGQNDALTLDDIPRIVAVEQSREQQHQQQQQYQQQGPLTEADAARGHSRTLSAGRDNELRAEDLQPRIARRYFSELSGLEYFNVRHLAVLTMKPMIEQEFSLEELLSFIESRKQATFWKNLGKALRNDKNKNVKKKGVFGVPLEVIIERDGADSTDGVGPGTLRIPAIVDDIISSMRQMDLSVEGVFRKNGNIKKQQETVDKVNAEGCDTINFMEQPVIQLAALLKRYLRDLPDPLMTHKLYKLWISAAKIADPERRKQCLHLTCCLLPKSHRDCLEILFTFLKWAGSFHQLDEEIGSKMDIRNLATVIAPNVLININKAPALDSEAGIVIDAVEMLIANIEEMCQVPDEILTLLNDPYIFSNNAEVTTKEILKRFQDRRGQVAITDVNEVYNRADHSFRPPPRRVETDPTVWQGETTVRPVQDVPMPPGEAGHGTPPQRFRKGMEGPGSPYQQNQFNQSDTHLDSEHSQRREWRNSAWGRQGSGLGVGGN